MSRQDWKTQAEKELRGRALDDLTWERFLGVTHRNSGHNTYILTMEAQ